MVLFFFVWSVPFVSHGAEGPEVAFVALRDVRSASDSTPEGWAMARYIARDVKILRRVLEVPREKTSGCLEEHLSTDRRRLPPSEVISLARCLEADEAFWGTYEAYTERYTIGLDYWNGAMSSVRHYEVSGPRDEIFATLDRAVLDLAEQSNWEVTREAKAEFRNRETSSFPAYMTYHEGRDLYEEGNYAEAAERFRSMASAESRLPWARLFLGNCLMREGEVSGAVAEYEALTKDAPEFLPGWVNLGVACMNQDRAWKARQVLREASRRFEDSPVLYYNLGNAYRILEKDMETVDAYKAAIRLDPGFADPYHQLAVFYKSRDVISKARENSRIAQRLRPDLTPDLVQNLIPLKCILMEGKDEYRAEVDYAAVGLPEPGMAPETPESSG